MSKEKKYAILAEASKLVREQGMVVNSEFAQVEYDPEQLQEENDNIHR
jgi:hypothetical protein